MVEIGDIAGVQLLSIDHQEFQPSAIEVDPKGLVLIGEGGEGEGDDDHSLIQTALHKA